MRSIIGAVAVLSVSEAARRKISEESSLESSLESGFTQTTVSGCECRSECGTSITDAHSCDTCSTSRCGKWGVTGRYDYCNYSPQNSFESKSASDKINYYNQNLARDPNTRMELPSLASVLLGNYRSSVHTTFDNFLPEMPEGRTKFIHTVGSVCRVDFEVASNSKYTGLLAPGTQKGFVRIGSAAAPTKDGIQPGWGFKFPRSGVQSGDFVAMHTTTDGQSFNFFASNISNHIAPASGPLVVLAKKFEQATICSTQVGLSDFAKYSQSGSKFSSPKFPFKLFFTPTQDVQTRTTRKTVDQLNEEFASWSVGITMFDVYACDTPTARESEAPSSLEQHCGGRSYLGKVKLAGKCSASDYGDQKFHVRHQRIEEDWALKPEFKSVGQEACGRNGRDWNKGSPDRCEGAAMLNTDA